MGNGLLVHGRHPRPYPVGPRDVIVGIAAGVAQDVSRDRHDQVVAVHEVPVQGHRRRADGLGGAGHGQGRSRVTTQHLGHRIENPLPGEPPGPAPPQLLYRLHFDRVRLRRIL